MLGRLSGRLTLVGNAANPFSPRLVSGVADEVCAMLASDWEGVSIVPGQLRQHVRRAVRRMSVEAGKGLGDRVHDMWRGHGESLHLDWNVPLEEALKDADIILVATSSETALINPNKLKPGTLVCDVARPRNVAQAKTDACDVLVFDGGLIAPPFDIDLGPFQTLPVGVCWGCLGETLLLALAGEPRHYSIGSRLALGDADHMATLAEAHGFDPAPAQWLGRNLNDDEIATFAQHVVQRNARFRSARRQPDSGLIDHIPKMPIATIAMVDMSMCSQQP